MRVVLASGNKGKLRELASLLVPMAVAAVVLLIQRLRLPAFLALMATVVVYGIAADMTYQSVGKAFGQGFTTALEQTGLLVIAAARLQPGGDS